MGANRVDGSAVFLAASLFFFVVGGVIPLTAERARSEYTAMLEACERSLPRSQRCVLVAIPEEQSDAR